MKMPLEKMSQPSTKSSRGIPLSTIKGTRRRIIMMTIQKLEMCALVWFSELCGLKLLDMTCHDKVVERLGPGKKIMEPRKGKRKTRTRQSRFRHPISGRTSCHVAEIFLWRETTTETMKNHHACSSFIAFMLISLAFVANDVHSAPHVVGTDEVISRTLLSLTSALDN